MIKIKDRFSGEIIYQSKTATTIKEAVEEAVKNKIDLSKADLSGCNLSRANLMFCKMDKKVFKQITEEWFEWEIKED